MESAGNVVSSRNVPEAPRLSRHVPHRGAAARAVHAVALGVGLCAAGHAVESVAAEMQAWPGVVLAAHRTQVTAELDGRVVALPRAAGSRVEVGVLLAVLEVPELEAELDRAEANLALARAEVDEAAATVRSRESELERRQAAGASVSREDLGIARGQLETAQARLASAMARLRSAEADRALFALRASRTQVTSSLHGVVGVHHVSLGDTVQRGAPLMDLADDSTVLVRFAVPSAEAGSVRAGQTVWVRGHAGQAMPAVVSSMAPGVDPLAQLLRVEAELQAPAGGLLGHGVQVSPVAPVSPTLPSRTGNGADAY